VKTTLEIPDAIFRRAKAAAAARGQTLKQLVNEAISDKLAKPEAERQPDWMQLFGSLKEHADELRRIDATIDKEFERIDPDVWK
jgi:hypothetical protein